MDVILVARHADFSVGAIAPYDVAIERARDLYALGWEVDLTDTAGNPVARAPTPTAAELHTELAP